MKKSFILALAAGACVLGLAIHQMAATSSGLANTKAANFGFGLQIAGSYMADFTQLGPLPRPPVPALTTLHADGTVITTDVQTMFGSGNLALVGYRSPIHGVWTCTGPKQIGFRQVGYALDENGDLGSPVLGGGSLLRTTGELIFSDDFRTFTGEATVDIFMPGQDPMDPSETPAFSIPITIDGRLIEVP